MNINSDTLTNNKAIIIVGMFVLLAIKMAALKQTPASNIRKAI